MTKSRKNVHHYLDSGLENVVFTIDDDAFVALRPDIGTHIDKLFDHHVNL